MSAVRIDTTDPGAGQTPDRLRLLLGFAGVLLVGVGDYVTGADVAFTLLYLGPVSYIAWNCGRRAALVAALLSSLAWLVDDIATREAQLRVAVHVFNFGVQMITFLAFGVLVALLRVRLEREEQHANTDPLTGLGNSRAFHATARLELERSRRFHLPFSVAYFDVDRFKRINDQFGHVVGDHVLQALADAVQGSVRQLDLVARLGGDEFVVFLPGTDMAGATVAMDKLRSRLAGARWPGGMPVTCSIGCITFATPPASVDELLAQADQLMYEAKRMGGDRCRHAVHEVPPLDVTSNRRAAGS